MRLKVSLVCGLCDKAIDTENTQNINVLVADHLKQHGVSYFSKEHRIIVVPFKDDEFDEWLGNVLAWRAKEHERL